MRNQKTRNRRQPVPHMVRMFEQALRLDEKMPPPDRRSSLVKSYMDEFNVVEQLAAEYQEAYDNGPEGQFGQTQILTLAILNTLKQHKAVVAGLPCQMVKVRLVCEWVMPAGMTLEQVRTTLHHNRDTLDLISIRGAERELAEFYVEMPGGPIGTYTALDLANP